MRSGPSAARASGREGAGGPGVVGEAPGRAATGAGTPRREGARSPFGGAALGFLRIIAGELGGRRIRTPPGAGVRPTSERVREALFSILGPSVVDARVLDAFAGSGALGIEALSRGARAAEFIESAPDALAVLRSNVAGLGLGDRARIVQAGAVSALARRLVRPPFDLILADPPYGSPVATRFLSAIASGPWISAGGQLVIERGKADPPGEGTKGLTLTNSRRYGDTCLEFYSP